MFIYTLTHKDLRKTYVGISGKVPEEDVYELPSNTRISRAISNFGIDKFYITKIGELNNREKAIDKANFLIEKFEDVYNEKFYELKVQNEDIFKTMPGGLHFILPNYNG